MRKKILPFLSMMLVASFAVTATAQEYNFMTFKQGASLSGYETSLPIEKLKITFAGGNLLATSTAGTKTFPLNTLSQMFFTSTPTSIELEGVNSNPLIGIVGSTLTINAPAGSLARVYDASGKQLISTTTCVNGASMNLSSLAKGLYFLKVGQRTFKIMKK
ncbi:MAG: T9SS type A sorting domain-containing protein [Bacteroidaceae bacterium]